MITICSDLHIGGLICCVLHMCVCVCPLQRVGDVA